VADDGLAVESPAGLPDLMEVGMKQPLEPFPRAARPRVVKLGFEGLELTEEVIIGQC
jgi:hypothetical protein